MVAARRTPSGGAAAGVYFLGGGAGDRAGKAKAAGLLWPARFTERTPNRTLSLETATVACVAVPAE